MKKLVLLSVFVAGLNSTSCDYKLPLRQHGNEAVFQRFSRALQPPQGKEHCGRYLIDLTKVAPFAWDSVYFLVGDSPSSDSATYELGKHKWRSPVIPDHYRRLVFMAHQRVVTYIDCPELADPEVGEISLCIALDGSCEGLYAAIGRAHAQLFTSHIMDRSVVHYPLIPADCTADELNQRLAPDCH